MDVISAVLGTAARTMALMAGVLVPLAMAALPWLQRNGGGR